MTQAKTVVGRTANRKSQGLSPMYKKKAYKLHVQSNLNSSNVDGSFTMANSNSFFETLWNSSDSSRKHIFIEIFLLYYEIVCCVYSLESPHRGDSNKYTQHTIIV